MPTIPRDVQEFLYRYPNGGDDRSQSANLKFYTNKLRCRPDNLLIEEIHDQWWGDYETLEYNHGFIQWLFPIREHGMNFQSQPLQPHELKSMKSDPAVIQRILTSYKLMLVFYGMNLVSEETGLLERSQDYKPRYRNLVYSSHNNLRISRILKSLSEFGLERLNAGFLLHVLNEQSEFRKLDSGGIRSSMDRWWVNCIRNDAEREWIGDVIAKVRAGDGYVFTREAYEEALEKRRKDGSFSS
ncbi:opioid growth factor receptor-like 1-like [Moniliophthora roreri MCA 2997]|uniref:Opioid growth factor receptor-like 1-like n=2 Tax=Moniliophthora roreri TaxID=221103 RepID=V2XT87_MONRO|nr:opioid growth factor receptor-like 1-like [Moniliophthora roreri MCA 2997]KAI3616149.1 opioid growth factor receptor-like 1-like [Moniliophthora roreri]